MTFIYILLVLILLAIFYFIYLQKNSKPNEIDLSKAIDTLVKQSNDKLNDKNLQIQTDLSNKKDAIEKMIKQISDQLTTVEKDRIGTFTNLRDAIENNVKLTKELSVTTEGLKRVLSNNQQRGAFGEKVAEDLLKMSGFVIGTDYTRQETTGEARPDFTLYLPDKTKINIDSKFPYANIVNMSETPDNDEKKRYKKLFEQDIKKKINDVTSRNYINPEDNTVDFVILFIPNEMIFSFIYESFPDVWQDALNRKVVMTGPFSFTAILRMVRQAYENFRFQKNVQGIITQIKIFGSEFEKYNEEFSKIGDRIDSLNKQYDEVNNTRTKKLQKVIDKINIEDKSTPPSLTS
ncbi:MAG: DNA recombination protein RmuC [Candidatus Shapirobacteria bacterium]|nr:DNA recombination protein RmuC [Candidatus Shapirobacteria bacterium]